MNQKQTELALALFDLGAFQDKSRSPEGQGFRLKLHETQPDAPLSPFYLNLRTPDNPKPGPLTPAILKQIAECLWTVISEKSITFFDAVAGIPHAGDPIAEALAQRLRQSDINLPLLKLGKTKTPQGRRINGILQGECNPGDEILLVDDVLTRAGTKLEAAETLKVHGLNVLDLLIVVDREQGGVQQLWENGIRGHAIFTIRDLLKCLLEHQRINQQTSDECLTYLAADS